MNNFDYDYLIVGSGLYGAVFAHEAKRCGNRCLVIDKRAHAGGNVFCQKVEDINVHSYGAHIFHTSNKGIWDYVNQFASFNNYINSPLANVEGELYNLPFNMNTFYRLWRTTTPEQARAKINSQVATLGITRPRNLEEQALSLVGPELYEKLIKHYTEKQWGRKATELPAFLINRLPLRFTFNNNYFDDTYQGIPIGGYNGIIHALLKGIEVCLNTDYLQNRAYFQSIARKVVYTGKIDEFFNYRFGELEYRSLRFEESLIDMTDYQGNAVVNYCDKNTAYTRIIEHKHFEFGRQPYTVITKEYPAKYTKKAEPFYPVNDEKNNKRYNMYKAHAANMSNLIFGGRLAEYKYYDMHQVVASSLAKVKLECAEKQIISLLL